MDAVSPTVFRVSGSLVELEPLPGVAMYDVVLLGERRLPAEVVAITDRGVTVQAYEDTGGLAPGDLVVPLGGPLSARLGPGLLGSVFDGLLRPLSGAGNWLLPGAPRVDDQDRLWHFTPTVTPGARVSAGTELGTVGDDAPPSMRVLVPPGVAGVVEDLAEEGPIRADAVVATVDGAPVSLTTTWPVRRSRPYRERLNIAGGSAHWSARPRPPVPGRTGEQRSGPGRVRHREDGAAAADRQVV